MRRHTLLRFVVPALLLAASFHAAAEPTYVVEITLARDADVDAFTAAGYLVGNVAGERATLYLTGAQLWEFEAAGTPYTLVEVQDGAVPKGLNNGDALGEYVPFTLMTSMLQDYAAAFPAICRLTSIGESVQGRDLWVMRITDNPGIEEAEPEVKYIGSMHGDEPVGAIMLLYLVDLLLVNYGTNARTTNLVDSTDISILVLMNPDGYEAVTRNNAGGRDLNRSFPQGLDDFTGTMFDGEPLGAAGRPIEVRAVMEWSAANSFALAANFHTGALIVNYPYDYVPGIPSGSPALAPDNAMLIDLSLSYSELNTPMYFTGTFPSGIVNGSDWYALQGGMQDWNYRYLGGVETTMEISNTKRPLQSALPGLWDNNRDALLTYLEYVHRGVRGVVTSETGGEPLYAKVAVAGNSQPVFTDADLGDYYRLLLPGTYTLTFTAPGHGSVTIPNVQVAAGAATVLNVALPPAPEDVNNDGFVDAVDVQLVINAALGIPIEGDADIDGVNGVNAVDIQMVVVAALS